MSLHRQGIGGAAWEASAERTQAGHAGQACHRAAANAAEPACACHAPAVLRRRTGCTCAAAWRRACRRPCLSPAPAARVGRDVACEHSSEQAWEPPQAWQPSRTPGCSSAQPSHPPSLPAAPAHPRLCLHLLLQRRPPLFAADHALPPPAHRVPHCAGGRRGRTSGASTAAARHLPASSAPVGPALPTATPASPQTRCELACCCHATHWHRWAGSPGSLGSGPRPPAGAAPAGCAAGQLAVGRLRGRGSGGCKGAGGGVLEVQHATQCGWQSGRPPCKQPQPRPRQAAAGRSARAAQRTSSNALRSRA